MKTTFKILLGIGVLFVIVKMSLVTHACNSSIVSKDTIKEYSIDDEEFWITEDIAQIYDKSFDTMDLYFDYIEDIVFYGDDNLFIIEYNNDDAIDYDHLAELTGRTKWYGDYIACEIDESILSEFKSDEQDYIDLSNDINKHIHDKSYDFNKTFKQQDNINSKYKILEETIIFNDGTKDIVFEIIKVQ